MGLLDETELMPFRYLNCEVKQIQFLKCCVLLNIRGQSPETKQFFVYYKPTAFTVLEFFSQSTCSVLSTL
jgi:hypothetical protein